MLTEQQQNVQLNRLTNENRQILSGSFVTRVHKAYKANIFWHWTDAVLTLLENVNKHEIVQRKKSKQTYRVHLLLEQKYFNINDKKKN